MTNTESKPHYDLVIVGGGLVGASLALSLKQSKYRLLLVEQYPIDSSKQPSYDERTVALTYSSGLIFNSLGIWQDILNGNCQTIKDIHISNKGHFGQTHLSHKQVNTPELGYVVATRLLGKTLWQNLAIQPNLTLQCPAQVTSYHQHNHRCEITIDDPAGASHQVTADLLIVADGGRSGLLNNENWNLSIKEYNQSAILSIVSTNKPHLSRAYERFTQEGPLALLPHSAYYDGTKQRDRFAVIWTSNQESIEQRATATDKQFIDELQQTFGYRAGEFSKPSARKSYPLYRQSLTPPGQGNILAIGNAAHTMHPVAGQGFNLALRDVATLVELIFESPVLDATLIEKYIILRSRQTKNVNLFTHSLVSLFGQHNPAISLARNIGLALVETLPPVKKRLLRHTIGLAGKQSKLSLGIPLSTNLN